MSVPSTNCGLKKKVESIRSFILRIFDDNMLGVRVPHGRVLPGACFISRGSGAPSELPIGEWGSTRSRD